LNISKFLFLSFAAVLMSGCSLGPVDDDAAPRDTAEVAPRDTAEVAPRDTEDVARCLIKQSGVTTYSGDCAFHLERGGSFSIRRSDDEPIQPGVTDINVSIVSPGVAEVRGLTTDGINSRWGAATRSTADGACWTGSDFEICAY
jgi:hypothetical protein